MKSFIDYIKESAQVDMEKIAAELHAKYPEHYSSGIAGVYIGHPQNSDIIEQSGMSHEDFGSELAAAIDRHRNRLRA